MPHQHILYNLTWLSLFLLLPFLLNRNRIRGHVCVCACTMWCTYHTIASCPECAQLLLLFGVAVDGNTEKKPFYSMHSETNSHRCGPKYVCSIVYVYCCYVHSLFLLWSHSIIFVYTFASIVLIPTEIHRTHTHKDKRTQSTLFAHVSRGNE